MGFKKMSRSLDFADFALSSSLEANRSVKLMEKISASINWSRVEAVLMQNYTVGTSQEGAKAYPPILLFKCLLLQKWFRIHSDPELENQINDRLSFKKFLGLSFSKPSPDHSTFSRFRSRLSKAAMEQINSEILRQFEAKGLSINEGVAVDARLVESASRPLSNDELKKKRAHHDTEEGQKDKNGKLMIRLKREDMASVLGTSAEYVINLLKSFKNFNLIDTIKSEIYILSEKGLKRMVIS